MPQFHIITKPADDAIWSLITSHTGEIFHTARGLPFSYHQKISRAGEPLGELVIDRKEKTITRNTVLLAYEKAVELMEKEGCVSGPKKLGCFGASYLYPVFLELGICRKGKGESLPWSLPRNDEQITTEPGDIILYQGNQVTIYYDVNTWSFTRLAKIDGATKEELLDALGDGNVTVAFWVEWSE